MPIALQILMVLVAIGLFTMMIISIVNAITLTSKSRKLNQFINENKELMKSIIDKYVDGIYDYDIVIRNADIDKIRNEWNELTKEEFRELLFCKYSNEANVSDGFYVVKDLINKITNKNVITVR